jgi:hypothetical protein
MSEDTQFGLPPSEIDDYWLEQGSKISPGNSLERIDTQAKYLFNTVSVVGTLLTGFGVFGPPGIAGLRSPWLIVPVAFVALSLALAMMGITPRLDKLSRWDVNSIRNHYNGLIRKRGRFVFLASMSFSMGLFSAGAILLFSSFHSTGINPSIAVRFLGSEEKAVLSAKVEYHNLPRSGMVETQIDGFIDGEQGVRPIIIFKDITQADPLGNSTVTAELDRVQAYKDFRISCRIRTSTQLLFEKTLDIHR